MALNLYDLYHGAALNQLVKPDSPTQSVYIINHNICLYVKYSQADGPWQFNFHPEHQEEIRHYHDRYPDSEVSCLSLWDRRDLRHHI